MFMSSPCPRALDVVVVSLLELQLFSRHPKDSIAYVPSTQVPQQNICSFQAQPGRQVRRPSLSIHICPPSLVFGMGLLAPASAAKLVRTLGFDNNEEYMHQFLERMQHFVDPTPYVTTRDGKLVPVSLPSGQELLEAMRDQAMVPPAKRANTAMSGLASEPDSLLTLPSGLGPRPSRLGKVF